MIVMVHLVISSVGSTGITVVNAPLALRRGGASPAALVSLAAYPIVVNLATCLGGGQKRPTPYKKNIVVGDIPAYKKLTRCD